MSTPLQQASLLKLKAEAEAEAEGRRKVETLKAGGWSIERSERYGTVTGYADDSQELFGCKEMDNRGMGIPVAMCFRS
jgi:hypothetical protein